MELPLPDPLATARLGQALGRALAVASPPPALLLSGGLGAGKTSLTRALVESLPGGELALVGSPSFNLMNCYPTCPPVSHLDLHRLEPAMAEAAVPDLLDEQPGALVVVEWIERLPRPAWPEPAVLLELLEHPDGRLARLTGIGDGAMAALRTLEATLPEPPSGARRDP